METYSEIQITFNERFIIGKFILFRSTLSGNPSINYSHQWVNTRQGLGQVSQVPSIADPELSPEEQTLEDAIITALKYVDAFNLDYIPSGILQISRVLNVVTIKSTNPLIQFITPSTNGDADFLITNFEGEIPELEFEISEADTNSCENVKVTITSTTLINSVSSPITIATNTNNPIVFDYPRQQTFIFNGIVNSFGNVSLPIKTPHFLNNIGTVSTFFNVNGTSLTINVINNITLLDTIEYSLDGEVWQSSNVFSGLEVGTYNVYIRDGYGCQKIVQENLVIAEPDESVLRNPFFYISKSNSIRFANRITFGDSANYKTDENTLSCETDVEVPWVEVQPFQSADVITTQIKSNYAENLLTVIRENGSEVNLPFVKKTNNIGVKDKRDARKFNLGNGKTGIYFFSGNNYDYDTNAVIGTYDLFGALPLFGKIGNYIFFDSNWYLISGTSYNDEKNAEVLEVDGIYTGADVATVVSCVYNLFNYEVYEAVIDMVDFLDETIQVRINANDEVFQDLVYLSEKINVKVRHEKTVCIDYWSEENTDIFYQTGIKNRIRLFLNRKDSLLEHESEIHKTDTNTKMLSASMIEGDEFTFEPVSKEIMRKLCEALTHPFLFLDDVAYTLNGSPEVEGPLERSNLHVVKAKLLKSGEAFRNDGTAFGFDTSSGQIPGLVESESGFIKY
jgi:hypothetical protein